MKNVDNTSDQTSSHQETAPVRNIWQKVREKAKNGEFTCPFCREVCKGLSSFGSHLKLHCT